MPLAPIPAVDAPGGAYRERPIDKARTALLSIDMQNSEWSPERMARARVAGSPEAAYLPMTEKIEAQPSLHTNPMHSREPLLSL